MSDIKYIQKYSSDGQGSIELLTKEELLNKVEEITTNLVSQEIIDASTAHRLSVEEALKGE